MASGKRWIAIFLAVVMMFVMAPLSAYADPETEAQESSAEQAQTESSASGESGEKAGGSSPLVIWISVILGVGAGALLVYFRKKR